MDICAPEVLFLFTDNFDYQHLRRDFVAGVLGDDAMGNRIHLHILQQGEYAARVHNLRGYDAVSRDVVQRWAYPLVPDTNVLRPTPRPGARATSAYRYGRGNVYRDSGVVVDRSAAVGPDAVLGEGSSVGPCSLVRSSVLGRGVTVGAGCRVVGSYLQARSLSLSLVEFLLRDLPRIPGDEQARLLQRLSPPPPAPT